MRFFYSIMRDYRYSQLAIDGIAHVANVAAEAIDISGDFEEIFLTNIVTISIYAISSTRYFRALRKGQIKF